MTPYDKNKVCRYHIAGYCNRGDKCWFKHSDPIKPGSSSREPPSASDEEEHLCSICYDKPTTYGLLGEDSVFYSPSAPQTLVMVP